MLPISKNVLSLGHNHLVTTGADDYWCLGDKVHLKGHQHRWLAGGYDDMEIGHF